MKVSMQKISRTVAVGLCLISAAVISSSITDAANTGSSANKPISGVSLWEPKSNESFSVFTGQQVVVPTQTQSYLNDLDPELVKHYEVIIYVDKSAKGGVAQRVIWLDQPLKGEAWNKWHPRYVWRTSTGRERQEDKGWSGTPTGIYNFHGTRQHKDYKSRLFNGSPMPYTLFIDYRTKWGGGSGIAFHAAPKYAHHKLGNRASGGCMRLHYDNAKHLFETLRANHRGFVPKMAHLENGSSNLNGRMMRDEFGRIVKRKGLTALIVIDDGTYTAIEDQFIAASFQPNVKPGDLPFHLPDLVVEIPPEKVVRPVSNPAPRRRTRVSSTPKPAKTTKRTNQTQRIADAR